MLNKLLILLWFAMSYPKVIAPTHRLTYLGIEIDTKRNRLPKEKIKEMESLIKGTLERRSIKKKELQSLAGKMNWASHVIHGARTFTRRVIDRIRMIKSDLQRTRLTKASTSIGGLITFLMAASPSLKTELIPQSTKTSVG